MKVVYTISRNNFQNQPELKKGMFFMWVFTVFMVQNGFKTFGRFRKCSEIIGELASKI